MREYKIRMFILSVFFIIFNLLDLATAAVFIADLTMSLMVEVSHARPYCRIHKDRGDIQRILLSADQRRVRQMAKSAVLDLEQACLIEAEAAGDDLSVSQGVGPGGAQGGLLFIYPGTKWCGPGNIARDWDDLGFYAVEDGCCREHDHCPHTLAPNECRRGLCNAGVYTRAHCDCDARFRRCLQTLNTETANTLGAIFFNTVQVTCFQERRPCSELQRIGYTQAESDTLCSQWKYRPSDKYVPLMPLPSH